MDEFCKQIIVEITESNKIIFCLELCDIINDVDILSIDDKTIDRIENYVRECVCLMSVENQQKYIDERFYGDPARYLISPGLRIRLLRAVKSIGEKYEKKSFFSSNNIDNQSIIMDNNGNNQFLDSQVGLNLLTHGELSSLDKQLCLESWSRSIANRASKIFVGATLEPRVDFEMDMETSSSNNHDGGTAVVKRTGIFHCHICRATRGSSATVRFSISKLNYVIFSEERDKLINDFANLTNTSKDIAIDYLLNCNWKLNIALDNFYDQFSTEIDVLKESFKVLSWNLDGLDTRHLELRTLSVINYIKNIDPDFIFLQELVSLSEATLRLSLCNIYHFFVNSKPNSYYCGILIKKQSSVKIKGNLEVIDFTLSKMDRSLLSLKVDISGLELQLMTSHLESLRESSETRKEQLNLAFSKMSLANCSSIFAGDLNIRDKEIVQLRGLPIDIVDCCQFCLQDNSSNDNKKSAQLLPTWEPKTNMNIDREMASAPGLRFDRMYVRCVGQHSFVPSTFERVVTEPLESCGLQPSDHWPIVGSFKM